MTTVRSLVIIICMHVVKVYNNHTSTLITYKVNRHFSFLPIIYLTLKKYDISNQTNSFVSMENSKSIH